MDISKKIQDHKHSHNQGVLSSESQHKVKTEQRKFPRTNLSCPVEVVSGAASNRNAPAPSRTDNISNGGCYLTLPSSPSLSPGDMVSLNLKIPRQTPNTYLLESLKIQARVVRIEPPRQRKPSKTVREADHEMGLALEFADPCRLSLD